MPLEINIFLFHNALNSFYYGNDLAFFRKTINIHKSIKKKTNFRIIFHQSYYSEKLLLVCLCWTLLAVNDRNPC